MRLAFVTNYANGIILSLVVFIVFSVVTTFIKTSKIFEIIKFLYLIVIGAMLKIIPVMGTSGSDVYWISKGSIEYLLQGINPYSSTFVIENNPVAQAATVQAYLPFTMLFEVPFQVILGDLRYGIVFADIGIALFLYLIIRSKNEDLARAASSCYMVITSLTFLFPNNIFDYRTSDGLTDPIMTFFLLGSFYAYMKDKRVLTAILIGLAIATRHFAVLFFIPMVLLWLKNNEYGKRHYNLIAISIIIPIIIITPFFLWSPNDFIMDTIRTTGGVNLEPSIGLPQWNSAIFPQLKFFGLDATLNLVRLIQLVSLATIILVSFRKLINYEQSIKLFVVLYVVFLATNNFTQYFYWFNLIPYLIISMIFYYYKEKHISNDIIK